MFSINGTDLKINSSPNYETKSSYKIRVQSTDSYGNTYSEALTLSVNDLNEAPTDWWLSRVNKYFDCMISYSLKYRDINASRKIVIFATKEQQDIDGLFYFAQQSKVHLVQYLMAT